jgi:hypothetical protein
MNLLLIIFAAGLGFTACLIIKKRELNKVAIGRKVLLTYAGQNDMIKNELPKTGAIQRKLRIGNKSDNFIIKLDEPIVHNNSNFNEIVIRERLLGQYIGSNQETAVELLLPRQETIKDRDKWDSFDHAAWLTIQLQ